MSKETLAVQQLIPLPYPSAVAPVHAVAFLGFFAHWVNSVNFARLPARVCCKVRECCAMHCISLSTCDGMHRC